jgi:hypothetical protein
MNMTAKVIREHTVHLPKLKIPPPPMIMSAQKGFYVGSVNFMHLLQAHIQDIKLLKLWCPLHFQNHVSSL